MNKPKLTTPDAHRMFWVKRYREGHITLRQFADMMRNVPRATYMGSLPLFRYRFYH